MGAVLGIAVGTTNSGTASIAADGTFTDEADAVTSSRPTILHLLSDGTAVFPEPGDDAGRAHLSGFVERVGDPVGLLDDAGRIHAGADLFASAVACLVAPESPATVVVTHPTAWSKYTVRALESALDRSGLSTAGLVSEAAACARWLEASRGRPDDGVIVVFDLGASALDITVVRTGAESAILGKPLRSEDFSGAHFDQLITRYVLDAIADKTGDLDPFDPATIAALSVLRADCATAKEKLSTDTETAIPVALPGVTTDVRLVRSELEDLIRRPLSSSVELIREALRSAEIEVSDVTHVLLAGGGGAIPLAAELVSSELGLTVVAAPVPALTAAIGAAYLAGDTASSGAAAVPTPVDRDNRAADGVYRAPVTASFPSRMHSAPNGSSTRRRIAIIASAAAAVGILTAGGLSIGTAANTSPTPVVTSTPGAPASTPNGGALTADGVANGGTPSEVSTVSAIGGGNGGATTATASANRAGVVGGATDGQPAARSSAPNSPAAAPGTPAPENTGTGDTAAPPAYTPPAPEFVPPNPGINAPTPGEVGEGFAKAANGIGQGLGAAVTGIGTGVGGLVGAVVDPLTGALIGK
ncbi:Hsp70 family protein [Rhodococcus sp. BE178]|uniref:Hsp70 family protein n=1 Tax=Rhodococcus sp. BE178 TaxID=2817737 RepID=UPI003D25A174